MPSVENRETNDCLPETSYLLERFLGSPRAELHILFISTKTKVCNWQTWRNGKEASVNTCFSNLPLTAEHLLIEIQMNREGAREPNLAGTRTDPSYICLSYSHLNIFADVENFPRSDGGVHQGLHGHTGASKNGCLSELNPRLLRLISTSHLQHTHTISSIQQSGTAFFMILKAALGRLPTVQCAAPRSQVRS